MAVTRENSLQAFKDAMRERLVADDPAMGDNVDMPEVEKNLDALGHAVLDILTVNAEVRSDTAPPTLQDFWAWVNAVQAYLEALQVWQAQLQVELVNWNEAAAPPLALAELKAALGAIPAPVAPPPPEAPSHLTGRIL
jgi:hypothetical protein